MKKFLVLSLVLASQAVFASKKSNKEELKVDTKVSKVTWKGTKKVGDAHNGHIKLSEGTVEFAGDKIVGGKFNMDMNTITNEDITDASMKGKLEGHLKSPDFFAAEKHKTATFVFKSAKPDTVPMNKETEVELTGDLTIKDITKPVSFKAKVLRTEKLATAKGSFTIDRTLWDIKYNSEKFFDAKKLADKVINDSIEIGLDLTASKKN